MSDGWLWLNIPNQPLNPRNKHGCFDPHGFPPMFQGRTSKTMICRLILADADIQWWSMIATTWVLQGRLTAVIGQRYFNHGLNRKKTQLIWFNHGLTMALMIGPWRIWLVVLNSLLIQQERLRHPFIRWTSSSESLTWTAFWPYWDVHHRWGIPSSKRSGKICGCPPNDMMGRSVVKISGSF